MNEVLNMIYARKSMRVYEDRVISEDDKKAILMAAMHAPTAGNQQLYTIIDVQDQGLRERLAETCDHQPFIAQAKMILIFLADCRKWYEGFKMAGACPRMPAVGDLLLAVSDANIAAQTAALAAESLGIGSCYIGDIMENCEIHREMLHLPEYVFPAAMLVFGYPTKQQKDRKKPERAPLEAIVSTDRYPDMNDETYHQLFGYKAEHQSYETYMRAFCDRKFNSDFSVEMSRSVGLYLKDFEKIKLNEIL